MEPYMFWVWFGILILTFIGEVLTKDLVALSFSLGALVSIVLSFINGIYYWVEIIVFTGVSLLALFLIRPLVKKYLAKRPQNTPFPFTGQEVIAIESITKEKSGLVKLNGEIYEAILADNEKNILKLEHCFVSGFKDNKVVVRKSIES